MKAEKLTPEQITTELNSLPGWILKDSKLHRELSFGNFSEAFGFMTRAALISEKMDHHPEWSNVYKNVTIDLTTHSVGAISTLDIAWARTINEILD